MTQHTPAPWTMTETMGGFSVTHRYATPDRSPGFEHEAVAIMHSEADARLIAAAPDLLEALSLVAELHMNGLEPDEINWTFIEAALAKARGEAVRS